MVLVLNNLRRETQGYLKGWIQFNPQNSPDRNWIGIWEETGMDGKTLSATVNEGNNMRL